MLDAPTERADAGPQRVTKLEPLPNSLSSYLTQEERRLPKWKRPLASELARRQAMDPDRRKARR